jgi:tetratricopeptide (TPR) repeat protein
MPIVISDIKKQIFIPVMIIILQCLCGNLHPQQILQPSRQTAYSAFNKGDYEKAFREFNVLLQNYPKDPVYKYYCGVCLVKAERDPDRASDFLQESLNNQSELRSVPEDAWFYLGRSQQLTGKFTEAIRSYTVYEKNAGRKAAKDLKVADYIQECNEGHGKLKDKMYSEVIEKAMTDSALKENASRRQYDSDVPRISAVPKAEVRREILPASYDKRLTDAMDYQVKADSLNVLAGAYRKEYNSLPAGQKQAAKSRIDETEASSARYQKLADEKFGKSETNSTVKSRGDSGNSDTVLHKQAIQDTGKKVSEVRPVNMAPVNQETEPVAGTVDIFSIFKVTTDLSLIKDQKIEIDPRLPAGLIYRIQIGVFSKPLTLTYFKGIMPVSGFKIPGTTSTRYFAGQFRRNADAGKALLKVRQAGFRDCFVVAVSDGKSVSLERAALLEKDWGLKPFMTVQAATDNNQGISVTPTLIFRVEITRTLIPVTDDTSEVFRNLASNKGMAILMTADGSFVYLIGKFITFESATEYAGLLKRNGYDNARVVAYLGNMEIPVEKAKQLFEKAE